MRESREQRGTQAGAGCTPCRLQVLLLEAYEQLENDVAKEVDRALAKQSEEVQRLQRRVDFLQVCARVANA